MGLPDFQVGLPTLLGPPGGPTDPCRTFGWASRPLPDFRVGLPTPPGLPGGPLDPSWTSGWTSRPLPTFDWASQPLPKLRVGISTPPGPPSGTFASLGGPPGAYWRSGMARETHLEVREGPGGPPGCSVEVGWPTRWPGRGRKPTRRSGRGREDHPEFLEGSGGRPGGPEGLSGGPGGFERPTRMSGSGRETHPDVREGSGVPPRVRGGVGRSTWRSGRGPVPTRRTEMAEAAHPKV